MRISRRRDHKLDRLGTLTGLRRHDDLLELGRIVDEVLDTRPGDLLYTDTLGRGHAIAVVRGAAYRPATAEVYRAGAVIVTRPFERVESLGAVAFIGPRSAAGRLAALLAPLRAVPMPPPQTDARGGRLADHGWALPRPVFDGAPNRESGQPVPTPRQSRSPAGQGGRQRGAADHPSTGT